MGGALFSLLDILSQQTNFKFSVKISDKFGIRLKNGSMTGLFGMLQRKEVHVAVPWIQTRPDNLWMEASQPCAYTNCKILSSLGTTDDFSLNGFLTTFDVQIWYCILGLVLVTVLVAAASDVLLANRSIPRAPFLSAVYSYCWMFCSALFCEGTPKAPSSRRSQSLLALWLLAILTLMNAFCGQFKASLTVQAEEERIDTVDDLANRPQVVPYMTKDDLTYTYFKSLNMGSYQTVFQNTEAMKGVVQIPEFFSSSLHQKVKDGSGVLITEQNIIKNIVMRNCQKLTGSRRFYLSRDNVQNYFGCMVYGFPMRGYPALKVKMNQLISRLVESDVFPRILQEWTKDFWKCEIGGELQETSLKFKHLLPVFYFLFILHGFSFLVFIAETLLFRIGSYEPGRNIRFPE